MEDTDTAARRSGWVVATVAAALVAVPAWLSLGQAPDFDPWAAAEHNRTLLRQTPEQAQAKSRGCLACHAGIEKAHASAAVKLGCVDCHGGDASAAPQPGAEPGSASYDDAKTRAHVAPRFPERWLGREGDPAANPERSYTALLAESPEFVRFVNPGDLRVAQESCGGCHQEQVDAVSGAPEHPLTRDAHLEKFRQTCRDGRTPLPPERAEDLIAMVDGLEDVERVEHLVSAAIA